MGVKGWGFSTPLAEEDITHCAELDVATKGLAQQSTWPLQCPKNSLTSAIGQDSFL